MRCLLGKLTVSLERGWTHRRWISWSPWRGFCGRWEVFGVLHYIYRPTLDWSLGTMSRERLATSFRFMVTNRGAWFLCDSWSLQRPTRRQEGRLRVNYSTGHGSCLGWTDLERGHLWVEISRERSRDQRKRSEAQQRRWSLGRCTKTQWRYINVHNEWMNEWMNEWIIVNSRYAWELSKLYLFSRHQKSWFTWEEET